MALTGQRLGRGKTPKQAAEAARGVQLVADWLVDKEAQCWVWTADPQTEAKAITALVDSPFAKKVFTGLANRPEKENWTIDLRRAAHQHRPIWVGDSLGVYESNDFKSQAWSAVGLPCARKNGEVGLLVCDHAGGVDADEGTKKDSRRLVCQPANQVLGNEAKDRIGEILRKPIDEIRPTHESAFVKTDESVVDKQAPSHVRELLWAGYWEPARGELAVQGHDFDSTTVPDHTSAGDTAPETWLTNSIQQLTNAPKPNGPVRQIAFRKPFLGRAASYSKPLLIRILPVNKLHLVLVYGLIGNLVEVVDVGRAMLGKTVYKYGPRSGLTEGEICGVDAWVDIPEFGPERRSAKFKEWFVVKSKTDRPFSEPGDSSAVVFCDWTGGGTRLTACGLTSAGVVLNDRDGKPAIYTLVQPISPGLVKWDAKPTFAK